ncbi:MAG: hypothetical protein COA33_015095, partial [Fluviicola sp.]|nr:hypothetical protein [Fluviicola sp.]
MLAETQVGTCPIVITRQYTVTDDCGNQITLTQTITVDDTQNPTATDPATTIVPGGPAPGVDPLVVIDEADNCGVPAVAFVSESTDGALCPETITRIYSVTDACGNTINVIHIILITDPFPPTASNPLPVNVECIGDVPLPDPLVVTDEADNQGVPTVAWDNDASNGQTCPEIITRTYSVTDACLAVIYVTQTITVNDVTAPTASNPTTVNVECIFDVPLNDITVVTDEVDNCTPIPVVTFIGDASDNQTCPETITRTYRITDDCGNFSDVFQTIIVNDVTNPTASNPIAVNVECIFDVPATDITVVTDEADNCTAVPVVLWVSDASNGQTCPEVITRTYSVTDDCNNQILVTQTITVNDVTNPTASNPATTTVPGGPIPAIDITAVIDEADNCTVNPVVAWVSDVSDLNPCPETIIRTYSVTDDCGNQILVTHTIMITDPILPTGTAPGPINVECIFDVPAPDPLLITDEADNQAVPTVLWVDDVSDNQTCPEIIIRTYSITDICLNQILVTQTITVNDITNPTASNPVIVNVECIFDVPLNDITVVTDEADNCTAVPVVTFIGDASDNQACPETITRTYRITDDCGNFTDVFQTIIVNDVTNPTASNPIAVNIECIFDLPPTDITVVTDEADNCTAVPVVLWVSDVSNGQTCPEVITRTYSITDDCNNQILVTQTITVNDITNPTASNPLPVTVPGGPSPVVDITVVTDEADNCTANPVVAWVSDVSDLNPCPETIIRTYSITDDCNNQILVTQTITITDPISPTGTAPGPINVECIFDVPAPDPLLITDEADNQGVPTVLWVDDVSDNQSCPETIIRTYSITDICLNQILVTQTITVNDVTAPTASNPTTVNVECIFDVPANDITVVTDEADNCTPVPVVTFIGDASDNQTCPETITRTYRITDDCGNFSDVFQTIIVNDVTNPTASNPIAVNVECIFDVPVTDITVVTDEADNCTAVPVVLWVSDASNGQTCPEIITRTYSITDDCNNQILVTQTITVNDITNPTGSNPLPVTVPGGPAPVVDITVVTDEADNCTANPVVAWVSDVSDNQPCPETIIRTYSITDDCNNQILVTQTITITDPIDPTGTAPADVVVECIFDVPAPDPLLITDEADNQAVLNVLWVDDVSDNQSCPETIIRTYSITDICLNQILVTQTITVNDVTAPTASNPVVVNVECIFDVPLNDITVVTDEADNCTPVPVVTFIGAASDNQTCPETITRTYRITDDCGNFTDVFQTIIVNDVTNPTASNPLAVNVECIFDVPVTDINVVTDEADNCTA